MFTKQQHASHAPNGARSLVRIPNQCRLRRAAALRRRAQLCARSREGGLEGRGLGLQALQLLGLLPHAALARRDGALELGGGAGWDGLARGAGDAVQGAAIHSACCRGATLVLRKRRPA